MNWVQNTEHSCQTKKKITVNPTKSWIQIQKTVFEWRNQTYSYIPSDIKLLCTLLAHHVTQKRKKCEISRLIAMRSLEWIEIPYSGGQNPPDISFIAEVGYL